MNITGSKGTTPFAIKGIIVMMSLLYVLGPIHLEMKRFLHTTVHTLEMPDTILSHQKKSEVANIHHNIEHKTVIAHHDHEVIDLVEKILKGADTRSESPDPLLTNHKIDKHISLRKSMSQGKDLFCLSEAMQSFPDIDNKLCKGYPNGFTEPPEVYKGIFI
jgi:hypothetical protein